MPKADSEISSSSNEITRNRSFIAPPDHCGAHETTDVILDEYQIPDLTGFTPLTSWTGSEICSEESLESDWHIVSACIPVRHGCEEDIFRWNETPDGDMNFFGPIQEMSSSIISETTSIGSKPDRDARKAPEESQDPESGVHACHECQASFQRLFELEEHAKEKSHKPFECDECGKRFSRRDARSRHASVHSSGGDHPCPRCEKYQGRQAFKRRDLLRKHMRVVHRDSSLPRSRLQTSFKITLGRQAHKQSDWRRHSIHNIRDNPGSADQYHGTQDTLVYRVDSFSEYESMLPFCEAGAEQWHC